MTSSAMESPASLPSESTSAPVPGDLKRHIGLWSAILLVIGNAIGSGIFLTSGIMFQRLPSASLLILAWATGGALALAGALTYAEMGSMYPRSGGLYVFLHEAYGPFLAFLFGWACLLVILTGQIAAIAIGFAAYFSYFFPALSADHILLTTVLFGKHLTILANQVTAAVAILILGALNYVNARSSNGLNASLTVLKVIGIASLPLLALLFAHARPVWHPIIPPDMAHPGAAFGVSMIAVLWAYDGWQYVCFAAGEIRNPHRNVPRALALGVILVVLIFMAVNLAYLYALGPQGLSGTVRVGERAATSMVGRPGAIFLSIVVMISAFGCCAAMMLVCARLFFAMGRDGVFPKYFGKVHPRFGTPHTAVTLTTIWAAVFALTGSYEQLYTYVIFSGLLFAVAAGVALFVLRIKHPEIPRVYRAWGYPIVPAIFIAGTVLLVVNTLTQRPFESLSGLLLIAVGAPVYFLWRPRSTSVSS
jgi:APA family basic amino acid/polyamine antiporter